MISDLVPLDSLGLPPGSIVAEFACVEGCPWCLGTGHVCAMHPTLAWGPMVSDSSDPWPGACYCDQDGGAPCRYREHDAIAALAPIVTTETWFA